MPSKRVVITGLGMATPIGTGRAEFWASLLAGQSGIAPLSFYPAGSLPVTIGGEVRNFDPKPHVKQRKSLKIMCRDIQLAVVSADLATQEARLVEGAVDPERFGVDFGAHTMYSELTDLEPAFRGASPDGDFDFKHWGEHGLDALNPLWMLKYLPNMPACHIAIIHDARGPNNSITQNDVSSLLAIAEAVRTIERGWADVMIAGGTGSRVHPRFLVTSLLTDQVSHRNDRPAEASRPFDAARDGLVNGEGAAAFVLEEEGFARARGAPILARILGYGAACEPYRRGEMPTGIGIRTALAIALRDAGITAKDVGHVNAHGASTVNDDRTEAQAIRAVLGETPVTAPKSFFGHLGAGTGAVELAVSVLAVAEGRVPATLNYETPDAECPVHVVHGEPLAASKRVGISISYNRQTGQSAAMVVGGP